MSPGAQAELTRATAIRSKSRAYATPTGTGAPACVTVLRSGSFASRLPCLACEVSTGVDGHGENHLNQTDTRDDF